MSLMCFKRVLHHSTVLQRCSKSPAVILNRKATTTPTGAILPEPERTPFGLLLIVCTVIPGLLVGAAISRGIANFLEENELFVPSDDDDDDY